METLLAINADGTNIGIPAADTILQSGNIKASEYNSVRIITDVQITCTGSTISQLITFKLKLTNPATGLTTVIASWSFKPVAALTETTNQQFEYQTNNTVTTGTSVDTGGLLSLTVIGAGADANTTAMCIDLYAHSIV